MRTGNFAEGNCHQTGGKEGGGKLVVLFANYIACIVSFLSAARFSNLMHLYLLVPVSAQLSM